MTRWAHALHYVGSLEEWSQCATDCRSGAETINSATIPQRKFRDWEAYFKQMYRINPKTTNNTRYRVLNYRWANFGWGRHHISGERIYHPYEIWLYRCSADDPGNEWY